MFLFVLAAGFCWAAHPYTLNTRWGLTGLLNIPTADMQVDGTFMVGANYLPEQMLPDFWDYNSRELFP